MKAGFEKQNFEKEVRIGIIDTGIRRTHQFFEGVTIEEGKDYTGQGFGIGSDYNGHGTFVASLLTESLETSVADKVWDSGSAESGIIDEEQLGESVKGMASDIVIIPLKCFEGQNADLALLSQAIYDAVEEFHCDIIQMSWGVPNASEELHNAVQYAAEKGVLLLAASGNDGNSSLYYPAAFEEVVGVGAVDDKEQLASYTERNASTFITAPGQNLTGAGHTSDKAVVTRSGSSYAVSYVTAAVAQALEIDPDLILGEIEDGLQKTSSKTQDQYGYPVLKTEDFLEYVKSIDCEKQD